MAGLTPDALRKAANVKSTITTPTAEGAKATTIEVAKGAVKGAATGGWVGAAKGAAISFAKTKAGRRTLTIIAVCALLNVLALPVAGFIALTAVNNSGAYGSSYRSGESAVSSGKKQDEVTESQLSANKHNIPWQVYLAVETVEGKGKADFDKIDTLMGRKNVRTIGIAGVVVSGKGLVAATANPQKALGDLEKAAYLSVFTEYGMDKAKAEKTYAMALKWAYGEVDACTSGEKKGASGAGSAPATPAPTPAPSSTGGTGGTGGTDITLPDGTKTSLTAAQVANAQKIIGFASKIPGMTPDAITIALMAALTESGLQLYANSSVPESLNYPHDAVGSDHDSVGFWQMRQNWGTTAQLMDIEYQTKAFFGGPDGPNKGSPRGLFDVPGWASMPKGDVAQAVEGSAHPDRYAKNEPLAKAMLERFGNGVTFCDGGNKLAGTGGHPMGDVNVLIVSGYGLRVPGAVGSTNHKGLDFGGKCDAPIYSIADGTVTHSGPEGGWGNSVVIDHGNGLTTRYAHMPDGGTRAAEGSTVKLGQQIGTVGSTGNSTGCHLHFETIVNGEYQDPAQVLGGLGVKLLWSSRADSIPPGAQIA